MSNTQIAVVQRQTRSSGSLLLATGLAFTSMILVPAFATSLGMGPSVTGALRIALMKASTRALNGSNSRPAAPPRSLPKH